MILLGYHMTYLLMEQNMNFNDYIIDFSDYKFFHSLPTDERLLFLYDLICDNAYGTGSYSEYEDPIDFDTKMYEIIKSTINPNSKVNIIWIGKSIILNSNSEYYITDAITDFFIQGAVMKEQKLTAKADRIFHQQKYCRIFQVLGYASKINQN